MPVNGNARTTIAEAPTDGVPTSFRMSETRRQVLETVSRELGHEQLSVTLRLAVDEFLERHFRREAKP